MSDIETFGAAEVPFEYADLNTIDPSFKPMDTDTYTVTVLDAAYKTFDKTSTGGKKGSFIKFQLAVTDHPKFSGRRVFPTMFPSDFTLKVLRKIADESGVGQDPGTPLTDWLKKLVEYKATFRVGIVKREDRTWNRETKSFSGEPKSYNADGSVAEINELDWKHVSAA